MQPFLFLFTEISLQAEPSRGHPAPGSPGASSSRHRTDVELPAGLQLMRPDGTFYNLVPPVTPVRTEDNFHIGILEPNGILRPFYWHRIMVKVREDGPVNFDIVPLTYREILHYPFNRDLSPYNSEAAQHVAQNRNRQRSGGSS